MLDMFWSQDVIMSSSKNDTEYHSILKTKVKAQTLLHLWCTSTRVTSMMYKRSRLRIKLEVSRAQIWDTIRLAFILWYKRRFEQARRPEPRVQVWKWYYNSCTSMMHDVEEYITKQARCFEQRYQSWTCNHVPKLTLWTVKYHRRNERSRTSCCMFTVKRKINQVFDVYQNWS